MLLSSSIGVRGTSNLRVLWPASGEGQRPSCTCHFSNSFNLKYSLCQSAKWGSVSSTPSLRTPSTVRMQGAQSLCTLARNQLNDTGAPASVLASLLICLTQQPERCFLRSFKLHHYPPSAIMASYQTWQKFQSPCHDSPGPSWAWRLRLLHPLLPTVPCLCQTHSHPGAFGLAILIKMILTETRAPLPHECLKRKPLSFQEISIGCKRTLIYT